MRVVFLSIGTIYLVRRIIYLITFVEYGTGAEHQQKLCSRPPIMPLWQQNIRLGVTKLVPPVRSLHTWMKFFVEKQTKEDCEPRKRKSWNTLWFYFILFSCFIFLQSLYFVFFSVLILFRISSPGWGQVTSQNCSGSRFRNFVYNSTCFIGGIPGGFTASSCGFNGN